MLSVTLFALSINDITSVIAPDVMVTLFVDDLSISFAAAKMSVAERKLQLTIDKIVKWASERGFRFSSSKTVAMHFCRIRGIHPDPDLFLSGQRITCVEETKFLGLTFDSKLTWEFHIRNIKIKCMKALDILRILSCTKWGADRKHLLQLHRSLIVSKLSYGSEIYSSATKYRLDALNAVHHAGIRISTGAFKSSPINSLLVDAGEMPLELIRQTQMIRYSVRVQRIPDSLTCKVIFKSNFSIFRNKQSFPMPFGLRIKVILEDFGLPQVKVLPVKYSVFSPWKMPHVDYCKCIKDSKKESTDYVIKQKFMNHLEEHGNSVFIYTDGSKSGAGVGFGVVFPSFKCSGALPSSASIFTAELYGILTALKRIVNHEGDNFTIFSDSKSVLEVLSSFNPSHPLVLEILEWLFLLNCKRKVVQFCWVPSHIGINGNEEADRLAKEGSLKLPIVKTIPDTDYLPEIKNAVRSSWQFSWNLIESNKMREITEFINPWSYKSNNRWREVALCRLRIGHTRFSHGFLMSGSYQPFCDDCLVPQTVRHLLVECPSLLELNFNKDGDGNFSLKLILGKDLNEDSLFDFIEKTGYLNEI